MTVRNSLLLRALLCFLVGLVFGLFLSWVNIHAAGTTARCFKTGEKEGNRYRTCFYDCMGEEVAITLPLSKQCPLSIQKD